MALTKVSRGLLSTSIVDNGNATAITIDANENVLVGTTDDVVWDNSANSSADNGHNLRTDGRSGFSSYQATAGSNATINVNRTGSDGDLIRAFKSGNLVGSIGTIAGYMTAGTSDTGVLFHSGEDSVQPWNVSTNAGRDNAINLGASNARFKDLYLSGGVNFSANPNAAGMTSELLDDYEEGTWTPALTGNSAVTYSNQVGIYTKIGNTVVAKCYLNMSAWTGTGSSVSITGLPFNAGTSLANYGGNAIMVDNLTTDSNAVICQITPGGTNVTVLSNPGRTGSHSGLAGTAVQATTEFRATIIYQTA